jgi:hypothetical protein
MGMLGAIGPSIGRELVRARVEGLHLEARRDRRIRRGRRPRGVRYVLGTRLVSLGYRLRGEAAQAR